MKLSEEFQRLVDWCYEHSLNRVYVEREKLPEYRDRAAELEKELAVCERALWTACNEAENLFGWDQAPEEFLQQAREEAAYGQAERSEDD